jgi:hypothetical protein
LLPVLSVEKIGKESGEEAQTTYELLHATVGEEGTLHHHGNSISHWL